MSSYYAKYHSTDGQCLLGAVLEGETCRYGSEEDAAARLEPEYGPLLRRRLQEIDRLQRLLDLPLAA